MSAAIAVDRHSVAEVPTQVAEVPFHEDSETIVEPRSDDAAPIESNPPSFGSVMAVSMPLAMVAVFVLTTAGMTAYRGDFLGAMGVAAYLAIWIGLGFGLIFGGAVWAIRQPHD